ncbi:HAMP domain-containing protein [Acetobacterium malicum]|uniref:histidine kinase n=1 Tax=Acetobacterium malicum TaxID=52692 RepID=A0ABR6Z0T4_9FIRM|nr:HAMP domain-containing sensor histidine kinase [Acetobacterium malicum]MBC3900727.1 HAMP domain-containing protein [Acetobacterium malicum]
MKFKYEDLEDKRINAKRPFWKEFLMIFGIVLICSAGEVLIFNQQMMDHASPWIMALVGMSYVLFVGLLVSLGTRYIMYTAFQKPVMEIGQAARKVAAGDFTVRVHSQRKDNKKDELEVLIDDFNKMVKELATIETLKTDFIANVSHEIKTPLAVIQSYASALKNEALSQQEKLEYADTITDASKKLAALVTNVLKLNKLENQEIIQQSTFSLDEQLRCCMLALEDKFDEKKIEFDADLDEVTIITDESLLEIVWNNLLTNAIKFTKRGGLVKIELRKEDDQVIVKVSDSGCGMSEETCRRIFDRFYQGDTSHSEEGNGLGLALVKRVVDLIGGTIAVESEKDKGTTFTVELPLS